MRDKHDEDNIIRSPISLRVAESTGRHLLGDEWPAPQGLLRYDPAEPYAVTLLCHSTWGLALWTFSRDLLTAGLLTAVGEGDVRITPSITSVTIQLELKSPNGSLTIETQTASVADFLEATLTVIPIGSEGDYLDLDHELAKLTN